MKHFFNTSVNSGNIPDAQSPTARKGVQHFSIQDLFVVMVTLTLKESKKTRLP